MYHACVLLFAALSLVHAAAPAYPVLPKQWHAHVVVSDSVVWPLEEESLAVAAEGDFYYDATQNTTAYRMSQRYSGRLFQEINVGDSIANRYVYTVDGPTGQCSSAQVIEPGRYDLFSPTFLADGQYTYVGMEYYYVEALGALVQTTHWQNTNDPLVPINYWHQTETNTPYRFTWGSTNPVIVDFLSVVAGFDDLPNSGYFLTVPKQCNSAKPTVREVQHKTLERVKAPSAGTEWPHQWHGEAMYTGNDFGFQPPKTAAETGKVGDIDSPTLLPVSQSGHFYYDWTNQRECNTWVDSVSHVLTKTLIVDGKFHIVTLPTNSCMIVPVYPVGGPLKPLWPTGLPFLQEEFRLEESTFIRTQRFRLDALNIGVDHAFSYWQTEDNQTPMQFQGPVLDFYPYGQSAMLWRETVVGFDGVDLDDIFYIPPDCPFLMDYNPQDLPEPARVHMAMALLREKLK